MNGTIKITVEKDMMHAVASIEPSDDHVLTKEYILDELKKQEIKAGIRHEIIDEMLENGYYHKHYMIAVGKNAEIGEVSLQDTLLTVDETLVINGDAGVATGNIAFTNAYASELIASEFHLVNG